MNSATHHILILLISAAAVGLAGCSSDETDAAEVPMVSDREILKTDPGLSRSGGKLYFHDTLFSGVVVERYDDGSDASRTPYYLGDEHGTARSWYPGGLPMEERNYVLGKRDGMHVGWWEDGAKRFEYNFENDRHEGRAQEWFSDGEPYRDFNYVNGQEEGSQKIWNEDGSLKANYVVIDGRRYGSIGAKPCGG